MTPATADWPTEQDFIVYLGNAYTSTPDAGPNAAEAFIAADAAIRTAIDEEMLEVDAVGPPTTYLCYGSIRMAILLYARRLFGRRDTSLGAITFGADGAALQIRKTDPDVFLLIEPWTGVGV
jgi:hypothetical protein